MQSQIRDRVQNAVRSLAAGVLATEALRRLALNSASQEEIASIQRISAEMIEQAEDLAVKEIMRGINQMSPEAL